MATKSDLRVMSRIHKLIVGSRVYEDAYQRGDRRAACELLAVSREIAGLLDDLESVSPPDNLRRKWADSIVQVSEWLEQQHG